MTAVRTGFRTGVPRADKHNLLIFLLGNPFENAEKLTECQIANLASPETLHPFEIQRLKAQNIEAVCQVVS
jgi:hypothetical protein